MTLISNSPLMEGIVQIIHKVKDLGIPVFIQGESGTGKEIIARMIHTHSVRRKGEFVAVNCSALPEHLLEAEFFGYARGAFTGANRDKKGLIEEADGGTFFFDEIGDLPLSLQGKLLRVLQEKEIRRIGENKTRRVNPRFISATNKDLQREIAQGNFREDLFYRLRVIPIEVPPLRERREDIPLLANFFLKQYGREMGKENLFFSPEAMDLLIQYSWPGNIRELENEVQKILVLLNGNKVIRKEYLSWRIRGNPGEYLSTTFSQDLREAREQFERKFILQALIRNNYNRTRTAEKMGLSRQGLLRLMKKYKIS